MSGAAALENALANPPSAQPGYWQQGINNLTTLRNYQAQNALAQIYQDPTVVNRLTGEVDQGRLNALISQSPQASWNAAPAMQAQGAAGTAQAEALNQQTAGHLARLKVMSGEMSDLLQSGQPITADQVHARLNSLGQEGILTTGDMNGLNADLASQPPGADLTGWLRNHMATNLSAAEQLQNVTSQPQTQQLGDRTVVVEGNTRLPGGQRVGTSYVQGQGPEAAGDIVSINVNGVQQQMTRARAQQLFGANYQSRIVPGGAGGSAAAPTADGTTAPPSPIPTRGQYIPPPGAPAQGGAAAAGGAAGPPPAAPPAAAGGAPGGAAAGAAAAAPSAIGPGPNAVAAAQAAAQSSGRPVPVVGGNGLVANPDGSVGTPGGGFRAPAAAAAPSAATTTATPSTTPPGGAADGATGQAGQLPVGKDGPYVLGDSIADGVRTTGGWQGNTQVGRNPQQVLGTIGSAPINGRDVVLSSGAANNPNQVGMLQQQIDAANKAGAKSITVMGVADPKVNAQLQTIAQQNGARFVPLGQIGTDGVHPANYKTLTAAVVQPAGRQAAAAPPAPAAAPPAGPPPAPATLSGGPPGFGTSFAPGVAGAQEVAAKGSAEDQLAFRRDLPGAQGRIFTAQQALQALEASKTGGGTQWMQGINSVLASYDPGFFKAVTGGAYDPAALATNRDLAEKYLTQIAMANASRVGPGTDAKLAAAFTGNPNTHITNLAAQDVLKVQIGLDRMQQAMGDDMQTQNVAPQDFSAWRQQWARTYDPRAFVLDSMNSDQRAALQKSLRAGTQRERDIFAQSYHEAVGGGYQPSTIANPNDAAAAGANPPQGQ